MKTFFKILFAPLMWIVHACSPLGEPVNEEISDSHYYNKKKTDIQYSRMGNWFELGNSALHADVKSFEVLTRLISRDKDRLYLRESPVEASTIDHMNLFVKEGNFMTDLVFNNEHVHALTNTNTNSVEITKIEDANPKTFVRIDWTWAMDDKSYFYEDKLIPVDFESFENLNRTFSKDVNRAYIHFYEHFEPIKAEINSFKVLDSGEFAMDSLHVYCLTYSNAVENDTQLSIITKTADENVKLLNNSFLQIGSRVFFRATHLKDLDPNAIEIINHDYIKDKNSVFYRNTKLEDADASSFRKQGKWEVGDKNSFFKDGKSVGK